MKREDVLINILLTLFVAVATPIITESFRLDFSAVILIAFLLISIFWLGSFIKEVNEKFSINLRKVKEVEEEIKLIKKDLNINNRLIILESWKKNLERKKGRLT